MGGGASRAKRRKNAKADEFGGLAGLSPAMRRRRRVLFGSAIPQSLEQVAPQLQFTEFPGSKSRPVEVCVCGSIFMDESPVCQKCGLQRPVADMELSAREALEADLVFGRLGLSQANEFRRSAEGICFIDHLLGQNAIELLGLGIDTRSAISTRLFKMSIVGRHIPPMGTSSASAPPSKPVVRNSVTCYELLALFSVIRAGTRDELLEFLFCLFDVDEDDKVSVKDFEATIVSYLEAMAEIPLDRADLDAYKKVSSKDRTIAARRIAELAVSKYGSNRAELAPPDLSESEEPASGPTGSDSAKASPRKKGGGSWLCSGKQPSSPRNAGKDSKAKDAKGDKPLLDEDSDHSGYSSEDDSKHKTKSSEKEDETNAAPKKKSRFPSRSPRRSNAKDDKKKEQEKQKDSEKGQGKDNDSGIKSSKETEGGVDSKQAEAKDPKGAKPTTSRAAPKRTKVGCCGRTSSRSKSGIQKDPPPLTYEQWLAWFNDNFAEFSEFAIPDGRAQSQVLTRSDTIYEAPIKNGRGGEDPNRSGLSGTGVGPTGVSQFRAPGDGDDESNPPDVYDSQAQMRQPMLA